MNLEEYLYNKTYPLLQSWDEKNIYAISFYVAYNECNVYQNVQIFSEFSVGYNTEDDCENAPLYSEERWNFAFGRQNNIPVIDCVEAVDGAAFLLDWYQTNGISNVGFEDKDSMYYAIWNISVKDRLGITNYCLPLPMLPDGFKQKDS